MDFNYEARKRNLVRALHTMMQNHGTELFMEGLRAALGDAAYALNKAGLKKDCAAWVELMEAIDTTKDKLRAAAESEG